MFPILLISYCLMHLLIAGLNKFRPGIFQYYKVQQNNFRVLNYLHITIIITMALPGFIMQTAPVFLFAFPDKISEFQAASFLFIFGLIGFLPWKRFAPAPEKNVVSRSTVASQVIFYSCVRTIFLMVYEWFFRGLLLITFCNLLGTILAIIINVFLYALLHAYKDRKEMAGCIPLGILLCVFTLWWQSIWPAVIFHLQIAMITERTSLQQISLPQKQTAL